ncbi:M28 family peptidase [Formosa sediminum]|uniref:M28 family peptidase n=1 Tax=Formosa sediminum TaxID=2594004 RepID=A0A516GVR6_9FLAO|nr:M28 family peptidase [Formosa sediminum]QDO95565.1 M28 family peptidase [Formosa sediminum]
MKKPFMLASIAAIALSCGSSQDTTSTQQNIAIPKDVNFYAEGITAAELKSDLMQYASDEFEGRETGQPGQKKAVEFLKQRYIDLGIPAAKTDGNYFQEVPLEVIKTPEVTLKVNNTNFELISDFVSILPSQSGTINTTDMTYVGYGIETETYSDYTGLDLKGKVVLFKAGEPQKEDGTYLLSGTKEASKWSNFRQEFALKRDIARAKGAKAVLFYAPEIYNIAANRYGKSRGRMSLQTNEETLFYFIINTKLAETILPSIAKDTHQQNIQTKFNLEYKKISENFNSENVAAFIKGTEKPNEVIVVSAHLDHEGIKNGEVYNGADDDGSGTVALLELAEAFKAAKTEGQGPKRSILFLHVTGEEKGLLGSSYYADYDPIIPLDETMVDLNIDMIGRTDPNRKSDNRNYIYLIGSDKLSTELHTISEDVNKSCCNIELDYTFNDDNDPNRFYYRSDHYNFAKNNIPVIFYFNGTHADYHKPTDTPDKIQYDLLENRTRLVFYTAWELANREHKIIADKASN